MANILTEWIKTDLYPALFNSIDSVFPEHNFKLHHGSWRSQTYLFDGRHRDRPDKTIITKQVPSLIYEQGFKALPLVNYVMQRDNIEFIEAVKRLAEKVNLTLPTDPDFNLAAYNKGKEKIVLLEDCANYFIWCLETSTAAKETLAYLANRGYSPEDIKLMGLGYIPSQAQLFAYLIKQGYGQSAIDEALNISIDTRLGSTHCLTIPYRSGGYIKGFKFRVIGNETPKYLNSKGLDKIGGFFNILGIKGEKDLIIVEGELDSLHATAKGVDNVVSTGGSSVNAEQIRDAKAKGAKMFTICFDVKEGEESETESQVNRAIEVILGCEVSNVYIVILPNTKGGKTDPDSLIKEKGIGAFKSAINEAEPYFYYRLRLLLSKYHEIKKGNQSGTLSQKEIERMIEEITEVVARVQDPTQKARFLHFLTSLDAANEYGINDESMAIVINKVTSTRDKEAQAKEFKKLLDKATELQKKGEVGKAIELLNDNIKSIKLKDKATEFNGLLKATSEAEVKQRQQNKPDSLKSGYTIGGKGPERDELLIPAGAITVLAAPTSHGKTTLIINMALNIVETYPKKEVYVFSYEEDGDSILINTLNTYINDDLSKNNRRTIKSYFAKDDPEFIWKEKRANFQTKKAQFFKELIETRRLNIHYTAYNSDLLCEAIRHIHKNAKPSAIFIDYIQLLNLPEGKYKTNSRQEQIKEICIALKDLAVETGLPIILGAQFNREVKNLLDIHPTKISEAGDIERIANLIVGFWNNNLKSIADKSEQTEIKDKLVNGKPITKNTVYATILKQRGGEVGGEEILNFVGNTGKIKNSGKDEGTKSPERV